MYAASKRSMKNLETIISPVASRDTLYYLKIHANRFELKKKREVKIRK